jgi:CRP-like cAMP-binding protein
MLIGGQGDPCENLYIIAEGQVLMSRRSPEGEDYALYLLGPGDLFGEGSLRPGRCFLGTLRAVTDVTVHALPAAQLPRFAQYYPQLMAHVGSLLAARLERAHRRRDVLCANNARDRVVGLLRAMAEYHGRPEGERTWVPLELTQAELGEMVGLARETVARVMADLEAEGTIRRRQRSGLWIRTAAVAALQWVLGALPELALFT